MFQLGVGGWSPVFQLGCGETVTRVLARVWGGGHPNLSSVWGDGHPCFSSGMGGRSPVFWPGANQADVMDSHNCLCTTVEQK